MSRNVPNINASLIREARMIAQQFLRHKSSQSLFSVPTAQPSTALKCVFCLTVRVKGNQKDAMAVKNGQSVCEDHAFAADAENFTAGVARLINADVKPRGRG